MKPNTAPTKINKLAINLFFGFCLLTFCFPSFSRAQSALGLTAIPPRLEITVNPGQIVTKEIKVRNESNQEKTISTSSKDFIVTDNLGTPLQIENNDPSDNRWAASSWIQISPTRLKLKPGETKSLVITIITPEDALAGGHYAMILHTPNNQTIISQTGASIETNVGTLLYLTVSGNITENASIKEFSAPKFSEYGPINFKTIITNLSDLHITPAGSISIYNMLGSKTDQIELKNTNIFPYTSREFISTLKQKLLLGRYQAKLTAAYGTTGQVLAATIFFWVIPYKLIALLVAIIIIIILLLKLKKNTPPLSPTETPKVEELEKELEDLKKKYQDRK